MSSENKICKMIRGTIAISNQFSYRRNVVYKQIHPMSFNFKVLLREIKLWQVRYTKSSCKRSLKGLFSGSWEVYFLFSQFQKWCKFKEFFLHFETFNIESKKSKKTYFLLHLPLLHLCHSMHHILTYKYMSKTFGTFFLHELRYHHVMLSQ